MLNRRYNIAPRVLIQEARGRHTSPPLSKVEHDALVSAVKLTGVKDGLKRYLEDGLRFELDRLSESI